MFRNSLLKNINTPTTPEQVVFARRRNTEVIGVFLRRLESKIFDRLFLLTACLNAFNKLLWRFRLITYKRFFFLSALGNKTSKASDYDRQDNSEEMSNGWRVLVATISRHYHINRKGLLGLSFGTKVI